jgi:hypothetical protein
MLPQLRNTTLQIGSPPTLPCPHCPRHFRSKGGRRKHLQVKHPDHTNGPNPHAHATNLVALPPSPVPSSSHSSSYNIERLPSPITPDSETTPSESPPSSRAELEVDAADDFADIDIDAEYPGPQFDQDYVPPDVDQDYVPPDVYQDYVPPDVDVGDALNDNLPPRQSTIYHPKLNGK